MMKEVCIISIDFGNYFFVFSVFSDQLRSYTHTDETVFHRASKHLKMG